MKLAMAVLGSSIVLADCATGPTSEAHEAHYPVDRGGMKPRAAT